MLITALTLDNIKSYRHATIGFAPGTIAIRGHNGAGKSTLVEAIGFALFDFLPYARQAQFIREGEKWGRVVVGFLSADDGRNYVVERRCNAGGGGSWHITDPETRTRLADGKDDVLAFLRQHLGLDTALPLPELFDNAIAVQQGTFTADFLQTPALRKKKFDALLQVEDYRKAAEALRETERYLKDQIAQVDGDIARLQAQTAGLAAWQTERVALREQQIAMSERIATAVAERAVVAAQHEAAQARQAAVIQCDQERERRHGVWQTARAQAEAAQHNAERARQSSIRCESTRPGYERHLAAKTALAEAQATAKRVRAWQMALTGAEQQQLAARQAQKQAQERLAQAQSAEQACQRLAPLVERQSRLEEELRACAETRRLLDIHRQEAERLAQDHASAQATAQTIEREITRVALLEPLASLLAERRETLDRLHAQLAARVERQRRGDALVAQEQRQRQRVTEAQAIAARAREQLAATQSLQAEIAPLPGNVARLVELESAVALIRAERDHAERSMHASQGGACPFLKERCLNMERRGQASLEDFFGDEVARAMDRLIPVERERDALRGEVERLTALKTHVERLPEYADAVTVAEATTADAVAEHARIALEVAEFQSDQSTGEVFDAALSQAKSDLAASAQADREHMRLAGLRGQQQQIMDRIAQMQARAAEVATAIAAATQRAGGEAIVRQELQALGNPRDLAAKAQALAEQAPIITQEIARHDAAIAAASTQIAELQSAIAPFADIESHLAAQQTLLETSTADHDEYLRHEQDARRLPEAQAIATTLAAQAQQCEAAFQEALSALERARTAFDPDALLAASTRLGELDAEMAMLTERIAQSRQQLARLDEQIAQAEEHVRSLTAGQSQRDEFTATLSLLAYCRDTIKEAGPFVMRALLRQISGEANRIFGEIIGDRAALLAWSEDYDIVLHIGGHERHFAQLSGGEQMSAALAVRLALLRTLTRATIAIFDEPTQNMDEERRSNLAEQIRRVRGFEQLLVISHDDTFEEGLDATITVHKSGGESVVESDDFAIATQPLTMASPDLAAFAGFD